MGENGFPIFARLTLDVSKEEVLEKFRENIDRYYMCIVCEEEASAHHLHILAISQEPNTKNQRQNLKNFLFKAYPKLKDKTKFAISKIYTEGYDRIGTYVVKEGNYCYYGFTEDTISRFKSESFPKKERKTKMSDEIKELNEKFQNSEIESVEQYINDYYEIRFKYDKPISLNQAETLFTHQLMKKSPEHKQRIINWMLDRLNIQRLYY